jgi:hypothetical protein
MMRRHDRDQFHAYQPIRTAAGNGAEQVSVETISSVGAKAGLPASGDMAGLSHDVYHDFAFANPRAWHDWRPAIARNWGSCLFHDRWQHGVGRETFRPTRESYLMDPPFSLAPAAPYVADGLAYQQRRILPQYGRTSE